MRIAYSGDVRVPISEYDKYSSTLLTCAEGHPVIAKRGNKNVHHYAHKANTICTCGDNKGEWHIWWQDRVSNDALEVRIESTRLDGSKVLHIADTLIPKDKIYRDIPYRGYVIEYQHSPMSKDVMRERESFYTAHGYHLVWVFDTTMWDIQVLRKEPNGSICIRKKRGTSFPMDAQYGTNLVSKILDFGKNDLLLVEKQTGNMIHGKSIPIEEFDRLYIGSCIRDDADIRPFHHSI